MKIFWSWQSELKKEKAFIRAAIDLAIVELNSRPNNTTEMKLIDASTGNRGFSQISEDILTKIDDCDAFIGDLTPTHEYCIGSTKRQSPNSNVLFETGYVVATLTEEKVLAIINEDVDLFELNYEYLPFDIRQRSFQSYKQSNFSEDCKSEQTRLKDIVTSFLISIESKNSLMPVTELSPDFFQITLR